MYSRLINPSLSHSFFLFGPRGTGKSTWLLNQFFESQKKSLKKNLSDNTKVLYLDLLDPSLEQRKSASTRPLLVLRHFLNYKLNFYFKFKILCTIIYSECFSLRELIYYFSMPRRLLIRTSSHPYHITSRSHNKDWFSIPLNEVWEIGLVALEIAHKKNPISIHAFVLMSNHYHLVASTPNNDIDSFMMHFNKNFSEKLKSTSGAINQKFGGRYKWCIIANHGHFFNVMRYVFRNPVRAGIVKKVENYPYSTIKEKTSMLTKSVSVNMNLDHDYKTLLTFFNTENHVDDKVVKLALRRAYFLPSLDKNTLRPKILLLPPN